MQKLEFIESRIFTSWDKLSYMLAYWRFHEQKIVFTNGCFDLLHQGHIDYLTNAAEKGDVLIVGLNTDASITRLKGKGRPVLDERSRALILASLRFIDAVVLFDQDTPYDLIKLIQPDVLVKGSDYSPETIVGYDVVKEYGGEVITVDYLDGYSTSEIIDKIREM
ncbi:MAG TPA: D-glycero-beta-D-manno-heptose 1-phosphate adenylyltransferase [Bacteroidales bacterium]|nr:D-glycero-beta-D-manno-heptose 1-phosphate adenylyltransferase [Bacteroidales bacterium]HPR58413.1 D-glycero-beta-D-manno-heptose 1-phosphate adenylyltransferase [Bacteroidales bacterium]HRW96802.1 D-glycero-beta-D-manno-heptose 1-phosphate adenylyltransferase [Bacteroidales bacterium]